jgi:hypothetical protein
MTRPQMASFASRASSSTSSMPLWSESSSSKMPSASTTDCCSRMRSSTERFFCGTRRTSKQLSQRTAKARAAGIRRCLAAHLLPQLAEPLRHLHFMGRAVRTGARRKRVRAESLCQRPRPGGMARPTETRAQVAAVEGASHLILGLGLHQVILGCSVR